MQDNNLNQSENSAGNHIARNIFVAIAVVAVIIVIVLAIIGQNNKEDSLLQGEQEGINQSEQEEILRQMSADQSTDSLPDDSRTEILNQLEVDQTDDLLTQDEKDEILRQLAQ